MKKIHIAELIQPKLQAANERLDKISVDICELKKSIEFTQDQLDEEMTM